MNHKVRAVFGNDSLFFNTTKVWITHPLFYFVTAMKRNSALA